MVDDDRAGRPMTTWSTTSDDLVDMADDMVEVVADAIAGDIAGDIVEVVAC